MQNTGLRRSRPTLAGLLLLVFATLACAPGIRLQGPLYRSDDRPYLSPGVAQVLDDRESVHRMVMIGDAGQPLPNDPTLRALGVWADEDPARTTVLYLGDNIYPDGLRDDDRARGEAILLQQIRATTADKIFLPGNHDWGFSGRGVMQAGRLRNEQLFIEAHASERAELLPKEGCPGPVVKTLVPPGKGLARGLTLIAVDFHWWLLSKAARPRCAGIEDAEAFLTHLEQALADHAGENVVVAAHHPLRSGGPHGGLTRGFWTDLGAGVFYRLSGTLQDLWEPSYAQMIGVVSAALTRHPPVAFVAGHDHSLQVMDGGDESRIQIVSGAGSATRITGVTAIEGTLFAHAHPGFVVFDFLAGDRVDDALLVRVSETGKGEPVYTLALRLTAAAKDEPATSDPHAAPSGPPAHPKASPVPRDRSSDTTP